MEHTLTISSRLALRAAMLGAQYVDSLPYLTTHYGAAEHGAAQLALCAEAARSAAHVRTCKHQRITFTPAGVGVWRRAWTYHDVGAA